MAGRDAVNARVSRILGWHARPEDWEKSDVDFVKAILMRYRAHLCAPIIDVNE
jgi:hypothetical protein